MIEGKIVRVRFKKDQPSQPLWVFVGKVVTFSDDWLSVIGKGILVFHRDTYPPERRTLKGDTMIAEQWSEREMKAGNIDEENRTLLFPRNVISNIRILPDEFDLDKFEFGSMDAASNSLCPAGPMHQSVNLLRTKRADCFQKTGV
jgi:hypothetical protein